MRDHLPPGLPPDPFADDPCDPSAALDALEPGQPLDPQERTAVEADLADLAVYEALLAHKGIRGLVVCCDECQQDHYHDWDMLRANLLQYAARGSQLVHDEELQRAFTTALGRALWNAMPLPRRGFLTEPIPEPGRNDPCPCGSGRKFKHCCARAPSLGPFTTPLVWPYVLRTLSGPTREAALRSSHLPREAVLQYASDEIEAENPDAAVELLESMLASLPAIRLKCALLRHDQLARARRYAEAPSATNWGPAAACRPMSRLSI